MNGVKYFPKPARGPRKKIKLSGSGRPRRESNIVAYESDTGDLLDVDFVLSQYGSRDGSASNIYFEDDPIEPNQPATSSNVTAASVSANPNRPNDPPLIAPSNAPEYDVLPTTHQKQALPAETNVQLNIKSHRVKNVFMSSRQPSSSSSSPSDSDDDDETDSDDVPGGNTEEPPPPLRDPDRQPLDLRQRVTQFFPREGILTIDEETNCVKYWDGGHYIYLLEEQLGEELPVPPLTEKIGMHLVSKPSRNNPSFYVHTVPRLLPSTAKLPHACFFYDGMFRRTIRETTRRGTTSRQVTVTRSGVKTFFNRKTLKAYLDSHYRSYPYFLFDFEGTNTCYCMPYHD